jgi:glucose-6-phosphate isomerase
MVMPGFCVMDAQTGEMGGRTGIKESRVKDLEGVFDDRAAFEQLARRDPDAILYQVHEYRPDRTVAQELIFGSSMVQPGKVGAEYFMTRGHIHTRSDRPEVYFCQRGRGVMHMETPDGVTHPVAMTPGSIVYVPPYWIHRSVNTGGELLVTFFCYPADAGQDYAIIERAGGMRTLIVDDGDGGWAEVANPNYKPRSADEAQRYMRSA